MFSIPLSNAVAKPWAVVVVCAHTLLAHSAVPCSERHVDQTLGAVPQADLDLPSAIAPLNSGKILVFSARLDLTSVLNRDNIVVNFTF